MWPLFRRWLSPPVLLSLLLLFVAASAVPLQQDVSSSGRRLATPATAAGQAPKPAPKLISIDDLLAGLNLSGGPKSFEVELMPSDSQRPAVVVSSRVQ
jgi:hypothetical protein